MAKFNVKYRIKGTQGDPQVMEVDGADIKTQADAEKHVGQLPVSRGAPLGYEVVGATQVETDKE